MSLDLRFCWFQIPQTLVNGTWSGLLAQANTLGRHWDKVSWDCNRLWSENAKKIGPQAIQHPTDSWSSGDKVVKIRLLPSASSRTQQHPFLALKPKYLQPHLFLKGQIDSILRWGIYLCSENSQGSKSFTIEPLKSCLYRSGTPDRSHTPDQSPTTPGPTCTPSTSPSASSTSPASTFQGSEPNIIGFLPLCKFVQTCITNLFWTLSQLKHYSGKIGNFSPRRLSFSIAESLGQVKICFSLVSVDHHYLDVVLYCERSVLW